MPRTRTSKKSIDLGIVEPAHSTPIPMVTEIHHTRWEWTPRRGFVVGFCVGMAAMSFLFLVALVSSSQGYARRAVGYSSQSLALTSEAR